MAALRVVTTETRQLLAAFRIASPSLLVPYPRGVLITNAISPASINLTASSAPLSSDFRSENFPTMRETLHPCSVRNFAVPVVAAICRPNEVRPFTTSTPPLLSRSFNDTNTKPVSGKVVPAANCALANARANESSIPMTSPVDLISGPSAVSTSENLLNGSTASLTET